MSWTDELLPCPFCGGREFLVSLSDHGKICKEFGEIGSIRCITCGASFNNVIMESEHYEHVEGDMYRKISTKYAEQIIVEKWNRRAKDGSV